MHIVIFLIVISLVIWVTWCFDSSAPFCYPLTSGIVPLVLSTPHSQTHLRTHSLTCTHSHTYLFIHLLTHLSTHSFSLPFISTPSLSGISNTYQPIPTVDLRSKKGGFSIPKKLSKKQQKKLDEQQVTIIWLGDNNIWLALLFIIDRENFSLLKYPLSPLGPNSNNDVYLVT